MALDIGKKLTLLPARITNELSIDVVGVLGAPFEEGLVAVTDTPEGEFANDGSDRGRWLSLDQLIAQRVVLLTQLSNTKVPDSTISVGDLDCGVDTASSAIYPLGRRDDARGELLELPPAELLPDTAQLGRDDRALRVRRGAGHNRLDALQ